MMILNGIPIYTHPATLVFGALGFFMFHKRWWFLYSESSMSAGIPLPRLEKPPYVTPHPGQLGRLLVIFCAWKMMGKGWKRHGKANIQWFFIVFMCFYHKFREFFPHKNWWLGAYRIFRHAHLVSWSNIPTDSGVLFLIEFESHWPHPYSDFRGRWIGDISPSYFVGIAWRVTAWNPTTTRCGSPVILSRTSE